ncbi:hypothetical protein WISP_90587 [Willisornis vidua]|uniref:Uncharacterized protein n=1 Tax=Willisornis vidua TaxID=1566151 RepID=A0ABQ9D2R7_9PASS|nr:hypothetical protein WISP_90587 [Willisornis vidua]
MHHSMSCANSLRVNLMSSSMSLMKILKRHKADPPWSPLGYGANDHNSLAVYIQHSTFTELATLQTCVSNLETQPLCWLQSGENPYDDMESKRFDTLQHKGQSLGRAE